MTVDPTLTTARTRIPLPVERVHVEVTNRCNFDCEFCPQGDLARPSQDMPLDLFKHIASQLAGGRVAREIHFHVMGEPLLYRDLPEAVSYASTRAVATVVTTNGSMLTQERALALGRAGLHRLVVSLQTPDEHSFRMRGAGTMTFDAYERRLEEGMRALLASDAPTEIVLALRTTAYPGMQAPRSTLRIMGDTPTLRRHMRAWARRLLVGLADDAALSHVDGAIARATVTRWNVVHATPRLVIESRPLGGWVKPDGGARFYPARFGTCHALREMFAVLSNGDLTFCCMDEEGDTRVGNARDMALADFFTHPEVLRVYQGFQSLRIVHPRCQKCIGEYGLLNSLGHQVGSVLYYKIYRKYLRREIRG